VPNEPNDGIRRDMPRRRRGGRAGPVRSARVRVAAAVGILVVWGGTTIVDIFSSGYNPPEGINTVALAAATYLFGSAFVKENNK
jgi:hypothetical protein